MAIRTDTRNSNILITNHSLCLPPATPTYSDQSRWVEVAILLRLRFTAKITGSLKHWR